MSLSRKYQQIYNLVILCLWSPDIVVTHPFLTEDNDIVKLTGVKHAYPNESQLGIDLSDLINNIIWDWISPHMPNGFTKEIMKQSTG